MEAQRLSFALMLSYLNRVVEGVRIPDSGVMLNAMADGICGVVSGLWLGLPSPIGSGMSDGLRGAE